jgi:hypothetical protein
MATMRNLATKAVVINVAAADQALSPPSNGIHISTAGNLVCRFSEDSADVTLPVAANTFYPYSLKAIRMTGTTAAGFIIR